MIRESFNEGWEFRPKVSSFAELGRGGAPWRPVTLPHDAMIGQERAAPDGDSLAGGAERLLPRRHLGVPQDVLRAGGGAGQAAPG